jgi:hypothetical protein
MTTLRVRRELAVLLLFFCFFSSGCLVRRRKVTAPGKKVNLPLLKATKQDLLTRINAVYDPVQSFQAKLDVSPSIGQLYGGEVTDYATITGYVLFLKPDLIRVIGLDPVIHSTLFDMVSNGNDFKVSIPLKSEFFVGANDAPTSSKNKIMNLRPIAFLNALLIRPPAPEDQVIFLDDSNETKAVYILEFVRSDTEGLHLQRNVYFDRHTLQISRQKTFDPEGYIISDTTYADWRVFSGIRFPSAIDVQRPQDGYEVQLAVTEMKMNDGAVTDQKFVLNPPSGAQIKEIK